LDERLQGIKVSRPEEYEKHLPAYRERLDYELGVIKGMQFSGYFLIVADFINYAKDNGIPVGPGRGSAAGSLVAYALKITDLDPIRHGLLFERFLNPSVNRCPISTSISASADAIR
jgi:DNA polymerase-3 subunit alpha